MKFAVLFLISLRAFNASFNNSNYWERVLIISFKLIISDAFPIKIILYFFNTYFPLFYQIPDKKELKADGSSSWL